jgi:hypothetical protein
MSGTFNDEWATTPQWAAMYRELGLQVVPAHRPGEGAQWKRPFGDWLEFRDNLTSDAVFARWFDPDNGEHRARRNMGLILGRASGGVFAIDLDRKEGSGAFDWWARIINVHAGGVEPVTWAQTTGGGGRQLLFKAPEGWSPPTFKTGLCVDLRGQGGFIIVPPSLHASTRIYDWESGREPWVIPILEAPDWLIEEIESLREEYGGPPGGEARESAPVEDVKSGFGLTVDGRESKLRDVVWAAVVDLFRESPIPPTQDAQEAEIQRIWTQYQVTTKTRLERRPGESNGEALEREGRGLSELRRKFAYAMKSWDTKVADAAGEPRPGKPDPAPVVASESFLGADATDSTLDDAEHSDPISAADFHGSAPEQLWLADDWIVQDEVNSLYGMGGLGKSLLAQQLVYAAAAGESWLGLHVKPCERALAVFCEDRRDELHRRHDAIRRGNGHAIGNPYGGAYLWARYGFNNSLLTYQQGRPILGAFHDRLRATLESLNPGLLILDTIRDVFTGEERDPAQVNTFLKTVLGGLILAQLERGHSLTILLLGHPSRVGKQEGDGLAGSLAWENGVRSRLYLSKPETGDANERTLMRGKANYSASGEQTGLPILWRDGIFEACGGAAVKASVREQNLVGLVKSKVEFQWSVGRPYMDRRGHDRNLHTLLVQQLCDGAGIGVATALQAIREAIEDGEIYLSKNTAKRGWRTGRDEPSQ